MNERVQALVKALAENAELRAAVAASPSLEETVRLANAHGVSVTAADLDSGAMADVDDATLEAVAGGARSLACAAVKYSGVAWCT